MVPAPLHAHRSVSALRRVAARVGDAWRHYYWVVSGALAAVGVLAMGRPFVARHGLDAPLPHGDTIILEYVGWFVARGNTLYVDVWEIKPPLAFVPSYLLAEATGGDVYALHVGGMVLTGVALVVTVAATARVVGHATDAPAAGFVAGLAFFAVPGFFYAPWLGYKAKALAFAFGAVGLDRTVRGRYASGGLSAGLAVGVWQLGVVFPLLTAGCAVAAGTRTDLRRHAAGGAAAALAVVVALLLLGDVEGFVAEVVLAPVALQSDRPGIDPRALFGFVPGWNGGILALAGGAGLALAAVDPADVRERVLAGGVVPLAGVLLVDFDGFWDVLYPLWFVAVGVGALVGRLPRRRRLLAGVLLVALLAPAFAPGDHVRHDPVETRPSDGRPPSLDAEREHVYWTGQPVRSCRFFGARTQRSVLAHDPDADTLAESPCGDLGPYLNALRGG
ncbi:MAG: DolP-mannose mannosyltransferase [Haloferacaceae archaeon]